MKTATNNFCGFIDIFDMTKNKIHIEGWAAFELEGTYAEPEQFILKINGKTLEITPPNFLRSDVNSFLNVPHDAIFGFTMSSNIPNEKNFFTSGETITVICNFGGLEKVILQKIITTDDQKETFNTASFNKEDMPTSAIECYSNIDKIEQYDAHTYISGWACINSADCSIKRIAIVDMQKMVGIGYASLLDSRIDVQEKFPFAQVNSGFSFKIPKSVFSGDPLNDLMFYGIISDGLSYTKIGGLRNMLCLDPFFDVDKTRAFLSVEKLQFIDVTLTHRCNLSCKYCCMRGKHHMNTKVANAKKIDVKNLLEIMSSMHIKVDEWQISSIGEMSMHPQWTEIADKISAVSNLAILSNFSKPMSEHEINALAKSKRIMVSIDTANPKDHSEIREGSNLARIVSNLIRVKNAAREQKRAIPSINIATVVSRPVIPFLPALAVLAVSLEATGMLMQDISTEESVASDIDEINFVIDELENSERDELYNNISLALKILKKNDIECVLYGSLRNFIYKENSKTTANKKTKKCLMPWKQMMLGIDMNLNPCGYIDCVGICSDQTDINKIINGKRMQAIRYGLLTGNLEPCCASCRHGLLCSLEELETAVKKWIN